VPSDLKGQWGREDEKEGVVKEMEEKEGDGGV
jgi:hypothetical protein